MLSRFKQIWYDVKTSSSDLFDEIGNYLRGQDETPTQAFARKARNVMNAGYEAVGNMLGQIRRTYNKLDDNKKAAANIAILASGAYFTFSFVGMLLRALPWLVISAGGYMGYRVMTEVKPAGSRAIEYPQNDRSIQGRGTSVSRTHRRLGTTPDSRFVCEYSSSENESSSGSDLDAQEPAPQRRSQRSVQQASVVHPTTSRRIR